ncbi:MAG: alpha amylase C-terminal domain-containing protein [Pseudomonadota bacterium]
MTAPGAGAVAFPVRWLSLRDMQQPVARPEDADAVPTRVLSRILAGEFGQPFEVLGPHTIDGVPHVVVFLPGSEAVAAIFDGQSATLTPLPGFPGLFAGQVPPDLGHYRLRVTDAAGATSVRDDPYRFGPVLSADDAAAVAAGTHDAPWRVLGARTVTHEGVDGAAFGFRAPPGARRISVVGPFNDDDARCHVMRRWPDTDLWELFLPGVGVGTPYAFEVLTAKGEVLGPLRDPYAGDTAPETGQTLVAPAPPAPGLSAAPPQAQRGDAPIAILRVDPRGRLAPDLGARAAALGFSHISFGPDTAAEDATDTPLAPQGIRSEEMLGWIDAVHRAGLCALVDLTPTADAPAGPDAARYWLGPAGADGLVTGTAPLWPPADPGAEAWDPQPGEDTEPELAARRTLTGAARAAAPAAAVIADGPSVAGPTTGAGGLGFGFEWHRSWAQDIAAYFREDPIHRPYHHHRVTAHAAAETTAPTILPLRPEPDAIPGSAGDRAASLRACLGYMWGHPGKKLYAPGALGLPDPDAPGLGHLLRDLNVLYRSEPALHRRAPPPSGDPQCGGFEWLVMDDTELSVLVWLRQGGASHPDIAVLCNFTPVERPGYRVGLPHAGLWREVLNTDAVDYGGAGRGNFGAVMAAPDGWNGQPASATPYLPPLSTLILRQDGEAQD